MKNEYIYERKGKKGLTLQVKVPYGSTADRHFYTASVKVSQYESKAVAYEVARRLRDQAIMDIRNDSLAVHMPTVKELYEKYWEVNNLSVNTRRYYDSYFNTAVLPYADIRIDRIKATDIQKCLSDYAETHSQNSVDRVRSLWRSLFQYAQMEGYNVTDKTLQIMPVKSRKPTRVNKLRGEIPSFDDIQRIADTLLELSFAESNGKRFRDAWFLLWILCYTGCRPSEVLALNSEDIDLEARTISVNKSVGSTKSLTRQIVTTKRSSSIRVIPIADALLPYLELLLSESVSSPLLLAEDGKPYDTTMISLALEVAFRRCGVTINLYQLRHKFSTDLFYAGVNPVVTRQLMGHSSSTMSLEYAKSKPEDLKDAMNKIGR